MNRLPDDDPISINDNLDAAVPEMPAEWRSRFASCRDSAAEAFAKAGRDASRDASRDDEDLAAALPFAAPPICGA
jgi:hypothetical protein